MSPRRDLSHDSTDGPVGGEEGGRVEPGHGVGAPGHQAPHLVRHLAEIGEKIAHTVKDPSISHTSR
jgi:hypothetical protein